MAIDLNALKTELTAGHPTTGAYNVDDTLAAGELNAINRPADGGIDGMVTYLATHKNRTNTGTDLLGSAILGRLWHAADSLVGTDPFGQQLGYTLELTEKHAAMSFLIVLLSPQLQTLNFIDTEIDGFYTSCEDAGIWKTADSTVLKGLTENEQSRATELGFGQVNAGQVGEARAI